jgi:hypothetical protein
MLGTQAAGANLNVFHLAVNHHCGGMNISYPAPVGMPLRMADVMTVLWNFAT